MNILLTPVKEHVTDNRRAPVDFERVSAHYEPLQHDTPRVTAEQTACGHQVLDAYKGTVTRTQYQYRISG